MTDYAFWTFIMDVFLSSVAIIVAVVFGVLAHTWLTAIAASQVSEKTAMMYSYVDQVQAWRRHSPVNMPRTFISRIEADIRALQHVARRADRELQNALNEAFGNLVAVMRKSGYNHEANRLQEVFDSLWRWTRLAFWIIVNHLFSPSTLIPAFSAGVLPSSAMCGLT